MDHLEPTISRDPSHNHLPNADTIAYTSKILLKGPGIVSQERAISGSFQQNLASVCNGVRVWKLIMGWIPGWGSLQIVHPFILAPNFVSVSPFMGILFPILRRNDVSTHWSSLFLIFMRLANCIFPWKELQRQSLELCQKDGPSRACHIQGSIP